MNEREELMEAINPLQAEWGTIGYVEEIHRDDDVKNHLYFTLGAIKSLITSHYKTLQRIDELWVYYETTGSREIREQPYCSMMLNELQQILKEHGQPYEAIFEEYGIRSSKLTMRKWKHSRRHTRMEDDVMRRMPYV